MKKYFLDLFEYNNWANDKVIIRLQEIANEFNDSNPTNILSHIISSQDQWLEKVKGKSTYNIYLWEEYSIQEIEILSSNSTKGWLKFLTKFNEAKFQLPCKYIGLNGENKENLYKDIFQNVINHSNYHRGQINHILKMNKIDPVIIDFINYC
jgi:uncharacterized damage-inducible protein DinB